MAIQFRCTQCDKLLQTPDETAGKQAKCPDCGTLMTVPPAGSDALKETMPFGPPPPPPTPPPPPPPPTPPPTPPGGQAGSPFGDAEGPATPVAPATPVDSDNPYQAPSQYGQVPEPSWGMAREFAASRVAGPAIALIVTGAIGMPFQLLAIVFNLMGAGMGAAEGGGDMMLTALFGGINVVVNVIALAIGLVVILGGLKMKNLENYSLAMAASIIAMIPCLSPCCWLGLPFGIWAIVILADSQVRAAFRS